MLLKNLALILAVGMTSSSLMAQSQLDSINNPTPDVEGVCVTLDTDVPTQIRSLIDLSAHLPMSVNTCLQVSMSSTPTTRTSSIARVLELDQATCDCLKDNRLLPSPARPIDQDFIRERIEYSALKNQRDVLEIEANGPMIQASLLAVHDEQVTPLTQFYSQVARSSIVSITERVDAARSQLRSRNPDRQRNGPNSEARRILREASARMEVPPLRINSELLTGNDGTEIQCISVRDFIKYRQFDNDKSIYELIRPGASFNPDEWDYNKLREQFNLQTQGAINLDTVSVEAKATYIKMDFLRRNPLLKTFFSSSANYNSQKAELFQKLGTAFQHDLGNCRSINEPDSCTKALVGASLGNPAGTFNETMFNFFTTPAIAEIVKNQTAANIDLTARNVSPNPQSGFVPSRENVRNLMPPLTGINARGLIGDMQCAQNASMQEGCANAYATYCPLLEGTIFNRGSLINDLERQWSLEYSPDRNVNRPYDEAVKMACESPLPPRSGNGPSKSFNDFRDENCGAGSSEQMCLPGNVSALRNAFWKNYGIPGIPYSEPTVVSSAVVDDIQKETPNSIPSSVLSSIGIYRGPSDDLILEKKKNSGGNSRDNIKSDTGGLKDRLAGSVTPAPAQVAPVPSYQAPTVDTNAPTIISPAAAAVAQTQQPIAKVESQKSAIAQEIVETRAQLAEPEISETRRNTLQDELATLRSQMAEKDRILAQYQAVLPSQIAAASRAPASVVSNEAPSADAALVSRGGTENSQNSVAQAAYAPNPSGLQNSGSGRTAALSDILRPTRTQSEARRNLEMYPDQVVSLQVDAPNVMFLADTARNHEVSDAVTAGIELPISVSQTEYQDILNRNTDAIKRLETQINEANGAVVRVRLSVTDLGEVSFIAYKEQGRVILQPVRSSTLSRLQGEIEQAIRSN